MHAPEPVSEYCPAAHMTAEAFVDPLGHAYPAVQAPVQAALAWPLVAPNWPLLHGVHMLAAPTLKVPGGQRTCVGLIEPGGQLYPA